MLSCLLGGAYKRALVANQKKLSLYWQVSSLALSGSLPYNCKTKCVNALVNKKCPSFQD